MTETMQAAWYERTGPAAEVLTIGRLPKPKPGPGEVLVRVQASGINPSDTKRRAGWRSRSGPLPNRVIPHADGAGMVAEIGAGVDASWIGRRVWIWNAGGGAVYGTQNGPETGTAAEFVALPVGHVTPLPENVDFAVGASLGVPACTAHYAVLADGPVAGQTVLVQGGAGAVGEWAVRIAADAGARVIATVSSPEKAEIAHTAGAAVVVDRRREDVVAAVREIAPSGVDRIVEVDFGANAATDAAVIAVHGTIASYSSTSAPQPVVPYYPLQYKGATLRFIQGYLLPPAARAAAIADIARLLGGEWRPTIAARFPLARIAEAHALLESGKAAGNVVVMPAEPG